MELTIRKLDRTLILIHRVDDAEGYSALSVDNLIRRVDDVFGVVGDDDKHVTTLNIVLHLLKSLQANEMLADGTSYTDSE